ncbi:hypothetical protein BEP19_06240 [Ammoniphilus oxalaticus]|uniref:UPF0178 protein BEP19_06240 n=1 Tax=Ammoniphilus oxalaticus TaxID=66863 RepID=A0A419SJ04_9BACL|nr:YaiI/YqxD family protein [Ammoniphilus oxalaticus]RKD24014.1 hypothetical protein BEP19_06240 [Ammoniphilus oxalaticus]
MKIYIDADACPVKSICADVASNYGIRSVFICSVASHFALKGRWIETITVDQGFQSADLYIANRVKAGDIVITDDYGLACMALSRGCLALSFRGKEYTKHNIELLLMNRHVNYKARRAGKRPKGPKPLSAEERARFQKTLEKIIEKKEGDC